MRKNILLHSCCGPCSTSVIERLAEEYNITIYFYNPNIIDEEEYKLRLEAQYEVVKWAREVLKIQIEIIEGEYDISQFYNKCEMYADEKEGGIRCGECFALRLEEAAKLCKKENFDIFTTTLTVSPMKNKNIINDLGKNIGQKYGVEFLEEDFKKKAGFQRSVEISKLTGIYRQQFCGCGYSKIERFKEKE